MIDPVVSIVIPTIKGREHWLEQTLQAFDETTLVIYEILVELDHPVCGTAWNAGIQHARGDYVLLAADDLVPLPGWFEAARPVADADMLPSALVVNPDGTTQSCGDWTYPVPDGTESSIARVPFATREQMLEIYPILPIHYATDDWFSHRGRLCGWPSVITTGLAFIHHFAMEGRIDDRVMDDVRIFWEAAGLTGDPRPAAL